jgi:CRP-like cAMP-binding protein
VQRTQMREAERGRLNLAWLRPEMSHRRMRAGQTIFRAGDQGNALYCLQRGSVRLLEIDTTVEPGEVFGEIGIFTPEHQRTCSALCETDVDLFTLDSEQVKRIYFANPQFAFFILHLVATRLMADRHRRRGEPS